MITNFLHAGQLRAPFVIAWMLHRGLAAPPHPSIRAIRSSDSGWADNGNQKSAVDNMMASGGKPNTGTTTLAEHTFASHYQSVVEPFF